MSHTNKTPNYELPQFIGTDKASWLGDLNPAFLAIDTGMQANKISAQTAETSAEQASAIAQSANSVANAANGSANNALSQISNWITLQPANPDPTNFTQYNCTINLNPDLKIASVYTFIEFKSGFNITIGSSGTTLINLPTEYFNSDFATTLFFSGLLLYATSDTVQIIPQYRKEGTKIFCNALSGSVPSGANLRFAIISRMFYVGNWLK